MESYTGFVKLVRRGSEEVTLAYQDATPPEPSIYLLSKEDFGATLPLPIILLNFEVKPANLDLSADVLDMRTWRQVSPVVLKTLAPVLCAQPIPTPDEWRRIVNGQSLQYCPTFSCKVCKLVRYVAPVAYSDFPILVTCRHMGLTCGSLLQNAAILACSKQEDGDMPSAPFRPSPFPTLEQPAEQFSGSPESSALPSMLPLEGGPMIGSSGQSFSKSLSSEPLKAQEAYVRGNLAKVQPTRATPQELLQYSELIKANPGTFGLRALMKIATTETAPKFTAPKDYQAFLSWKTSWESLFATHIVDNPKIQVQIATLTLMGEARDWWNAYWTDHLHQDITWTWFTDLLKATFYPLEVQENAFTAWNDIEFKDNIEIFFETVRRNLRRYPIPLTHLISILSFQLGKTYATKVKTRMAMAQGSDVTLYELQAITEELFHSGTSIPTRKKFIPYRQPPPRSLTPPAIPTKSPPLRGQPAKQKAPTSTKVRAKLTAAIVRINQEAQARRKPRDKYQYACYKCDAPDDHFCYKCPERFLTGCPVCGDDHKWQECGIVQQKQHAYQVAGISLEDEPEEETFDSPQREEDTQAEPGESDLAIANVTVPTMSWQTHIPLAALRLNDFPFRHDCLANPSVLGRLIYRCRINGKTTVCLFDSGANCSLISKEWVDKNNIPYHPSTQKVTLAQGNKTDSVVGTTAPLNLRLGAFDTRWPFLVLPHLSHSVILGTDFALWYRVTYDPYDWSLVILGDIQKTLPVFLQLPLSAKQPAHEDTTLDAEVAGLSLDEEEDLIPDTKRVLDTHPFLKPYEELFYPIMGNSPSRPVEHEITLKPTAKPKKLSPYPMSSEKRTAMHQQITDLLKQGAIEPSYSSWASPLLFVKKKDNSWRICVDFRNLNAETKPDAYPLPRMSTLLQQIGQATLFTKIDLASGFHQVPVKQSSREATAFSTSEPVQGYSHFQWKVMPFGLINAPATFQRLMESVLRDIPHCMVYIDDILIYTTTNESHHDILKQVLDRLLQYKLYIKPEKCEFLKPSVTFLGHAITENTITLDDGKKQKIQGWKAPLKSAKEVRQFWGLVS